MKMFKNRVIWILASISISYYIFLLSLASTIAFKEIFLIIGVCLITYYFISRKLEKNVMKKIDRSIIGVLLIGLTGFTFIQSLIFYYSKDNNSKADYMIILGAGLNGEDITLTLKQRLDKAIEYINTYDNDIQIIVSGGQGKDELVSEASAMKKYLISQGIDEKQIFMEDESTNTLENFQKSYEKIDSLEIRDVSELEVKVVTSDFHAFRSSFLAKRVGFNKVTFYTNKSHLPLIPVMYTREAFAVVKSWIFDR